MARLNNAINFGSGFNITAASPIDSRMLVESIADLTDPSQWYENSKASCPVFTGMIVAVKDTGSIYTLKKVFQEGTELDASETHKSISNWQEIGKESYSVETYQEAVNYPNLKKGNLIWINQDMTSEDGAVINKNGLYVVTLVSVQVSASGTEYQNTILRLVTLDEFTENIEDLTGRVETLEDQIKGLTGAVHFIGVSSTDPLGDEGKVTINGIEIDTFASGDVIIFGSKEFIYSSGSWVELGDPTYLANRVTAIEERVTENDKSISSLTTQLTWNENK